MDEKKTDWKKLILAGITSFIFITLWIAIFAFLIAPTYMDVGKNDPVRQHHVFLNIVSMNILELLGFKDSSFGGSAISMFYVPIWNAIGGLILYFIFKKLIKFEFPDDIIRLIISVLIISIIATTIYTLIVSVFDKERYETVREKICGKDCYNTQLPPGSVCALRACLVFSMADMFPFFFIDTIFFLVIGLIAKKVLKW